MTETDYRDDFYNCGTNNKTSRSTTPPAEKDDSMDEVVNCDSMDDFFSGPPHEKTTTMIFRQERTRIVTRNLD